MFASTTNTQSPLNIVKAQANALAERLQGLAGKSEEPFAGLADFAAHLHSHTSESGEVELGSLAQDGTHKPELTHFRATRALGNTNSLIPASVGVIGNEKEIRSGDLVVNVQRPGSDDVESTTISFLNEDDARQVDQTELDANNGPIVTLEKLAAKIDEIPGVSARLERGRLNITSDQGNTKFSLEDNGTGLLKHLGGENIEVRETFDRFVGTTFYGQMLSAMRQTLSEPAYFYGGRAEEMFRNQLDSVLAEEMTKAGSGEYSEALYRAQFSAQA